MDYAIAAVAIQAILNGVKAVVPVPKKLAQALAFVLSGAFVFVYGFNIMAAVDLQSQFPLFDLGLSVVVLGVFSMTGYDIIQAINEFRKAVKPE